MSVARPSGPVVLTDSSMRFAFSASFSRPRARRSDQDSTKSPSPSPSIMITLRTSGRLPRTSCTFAN
jgi:hypothetical protein